MIKTLIVVFAAIVAVAIAGPGCCAPKRWEGEAFGYSAVRNASFYEYIMYDFPAKRMRVDIGADLINKDKRIAFTLIEKMSPDNKVFRQYRINAQTGACTYTEGGFMREACVPDGSVHEFSYTLGGALKAHSYFFDVRQGEELFEVTVSAEKCIPIKGIAMSHHGKEYGFEGEVTYVNIQEGIRDPFSFETPDDCKKQ